MPATSNFLIALRVFDTVATTVGLASDVSGFLAPDPLEARFDAVDRRLQDIQNELEDLSESVNRLENAVINGFAGELERDISGALSEVENAERVFLEHLNQENPPEEAIPGIIRDVSDSVNTLLSQFTGFADTISLDAAGKMMNAINYAITLRLTVAAAFEDGAIGKSSIRGNLEDASTALADIQGRLGAYLDASVVEFTAVILPENAIPGGPFAPSFASVTTTVTAINPETGTEIVSDVDIFFSRSEYQLYQNTSVPAFRIPSATRDQLRLEVIAKDKADLGFDGMTNSIDELDNLSSGVERFGNGLNNSLEGSDGHDLLEGLAGDDELMGRGDDDVARGGSGNDILFGGNGEDVLEGGIGNDVGDGGADNDVLYGGDGQDRLNGGAGQDQLLGGGGADYLDGGAGADRMAGGLDNDFYIVGDANDVIVDEIAFSQGGGIDTVRTYINNYVQPDNIEIVRVTGVTGTQDFDVTGNDAPGTLVGNAGNNVLTGRGGNDQINGNDGNDVLIGNTGRDTLVGGAGADTFVYNSISESRTGPEARDVINGFDRGADLIDLSAMDANLGAPGDAAFSFIGTSGFSGTAGELRLQGLGGANAVLVEADLRGDGVADFQIFVNLVTALGADDFIL